MIPVDGSRPFTVPAPWRLHLPEGDAPAPLLVALHGKGDTMERFEEEALDALPDGWALLVPLGPIPRDGRPRPEGGGLGGSWYVYDGDTPAFRESVERASAHLRGLVAEVLTVSRPGAAPLDAGRIALLGFSQGAYLAGMAALRSGGFYGAAVLVGGRLKVEALGEHLPGARGFPVLGLHGRDDLMVKPGPSRASIEAAAAAGLAARWVEVEGHHEFNAAMRAEAKRWLADALR